MIFATSLSCPDGLIFTAKTVRPSPAPETPTMLDVWNGEALLTTHQAAALLGLSSRTLEGYRWKGGGPQFVAIARNLIRYRRADLRTWMEERIAPHTAKARAILGH